ncbi:MAG: class I SAM-dependent methyltransferase, partial [Pedosphaera sp.]|nr:class I SAM-dependent methyltransferase [Pedosphaera sp.]
MIQRLNCPITDQPAEMVFSRPYTLSEFQPMMRADVTRMLEGKSYEIRHSPASGLYFQTWVMEGRELAGWYSPATSDNFFMDEIGSQKLHWFAHMTEEILVMRQMVPAKTPAVLDFGCNWGKWASMALAHGCDVYAVEVNRAASSFCARRGIKMVNIEELADLRFDFINVDQVMEHLSEPLPVMQKLATCLKPGGFLKLSTPDNSRLPRLLAAAQRTGDNRVLNPQALDSLAPLEHVNLFANASLRLLGEQVGLRAVRLPFFKWMGAGQLWNIPRQF